MKGLNDPQTIIFTHPNYEFTSLHSLMVIFVINTSKPITSTAPWCPLSITNSCRLYLARDESLLLTFTEGRKSSWPSVSFVFFSAGHSHTKRNNRWKQKIHASEWLSRSPVSGLFLSGFVHLRLSCRLLCEGCTIHFLILLLTALAVRIGIVVELQGDVYSLMAWRSVRYKTVHLSL